MKFITSYGIAFVLILLIGGWLLSGTIIQGGKGPGEGERSIISFFNNSENNNDKDENDSANIKEANSLSEKEETSKNTDLFSVRVKLFNAQNMPIEVPLRGRTKANALISVSAETNGRIEQIHVKKGQQVKEGDLLCSLDEGVRKAQLSQAKAALSQAQTSLSQAKADYETNERLRQKGLSPENSARTYQVQLEAAKANLAAAKAALENAEFELSKTKIYAKVDGIIQDPLANVGDMMRNGSVCATIVQLDPILFIGKVAESKVSLLKENMPAKISIIGKEEFSGTLSYISPSADEATRSFEVEITIPNPQRKIRSGLSASAKIIAGEIKAHLIPQSSLTLASDGTIGVKIIDEENRVHFIPVNIIRDNSQGVFVLGLPSSAPIIIIGQEYVVDGQIVAATLIDEEQPS